MDSAMTLQEAKSVARHLGLTLRQVRSGDYRVNFRDGSEATAYYTDNLEDATSPPLQYARFSYDPFIRQIFETIIRADSNAAWHEQEGATPREKN